MEIDKNPVLSQPDHHVTRVKNALKIISDVFRGKLKLIILFDKNSYFLWNRLYSMPNKVSYLFHSTCIQKYILNL